VRGVGRALAAGLVAAAALGPLLLGAPRARAEHELWYRYVVLGYVKDAHGRPVRGREVEVVRDKTGFSYLGDTDARGFYLVIARLGDESAGETLTVKVGSATARVVARFDPKNHTDDRGTRVDANGARLVERAAWFRPSLAQYLGTAAR
jgi:hypothetical protein